LHVPAIWENDPTHIINQQEKQAMIPYYKPDSQLAAQIREFLAARKYSNLRRAVAAARRIA
jgi:hypothetical protein